MPPSLKTLILEERRPRLCRLSHADASFLIREHRCHLDVLPDPRPHRYRLVANGYVGVILAPSLRLVIRPKLPLRNLLHLLDPSATFAGEDEVQGREAEPVDVVADWFRCRLDDLIASGLHQGYRESPSQGSLLQGRLDVRAQLRNAPGRKDQLHGQVEHFTRDMPCNQVLRSTTELLVASPLLAEEVSQSLRQTLQKLEGISTIPLHDEVWKTLAGASLPPAYRPVLELARGLAQGCIPTDQTGTTPAPAFLLNLERLFERHISRGIETAFARRAPCQVDLQASHSIAEPTPQQPGWSIRPDVLIRRAGNPRLVLDVKWKRLSRTALVSEDVYQVLAYAQALRVHWAILVYPGSRDALWQYPITGTPVTLQIRKVRVTGPWKRCLRSLNKLGRDLRRLCT
jgi:5-methylcytosine-specific restriction enzyme subunit McrC